jgi:hypothetical protein
VDGADPSATDFTGCNSQIAATAAFNGPLAKTAEASSCARKTYTDASCFSVIHGEAGGDVIPVLDCAVTVSDQGPKPYQPISGKVDFSFSPDGTANIFPASTGPAGEDSCKLTPTEFGGTCGGVWIAANEKLGDSTPLEVRAEFKPASSEFEKSESKHSYGGWTGLRLASRVANVKIETGSISPQEVLVKSGAALRVCDDAPADFHASIVGIPGDVGAYDLDFKPPAQRCVTTTLTASKLTLLRVSSGQDEVRSWVLIVP